MIKMRILQILPSFDTGGVEEGTLAISHSLIQKGHASFIVSSGGSKVKEACDKGATHITLPLQNKSIFKAWGIFRQLCKIIQENQIGLIHARSRWPAWIAYFAAKKCGIPFITTFHGHHSARNFLKRFYNSIMVRATDTIIISNFMMTYVLKNYPKTLKSYGTRLHLIPRGIDEVFFDPQNIQEKEKQHLKKSWGIDGPAKIILMPARMTRLKGHHVLIDALYHLQDLEWTAVLLGGQENRSAYMEELQEKINSLKLNKRILIQPATQDMPTAYALADMVVCPTTQAEAFGRVIIESQAMGAPIIASDIGEPRHLITHRETGWKFRNKDSVDLATCIRDVFSLTPQEINLYAETARTFVTATYTKTKMCSHTLEVYKSVY